jgi:hypothetical protein
MAQTETERSARDLAAPRGAQTEAVACGRPLGGGNRLRNGSDGHYGSGGPPVAPESGDRHTPACGRLPARQAATRQRTEQ